MLVVKANAYGHGLVPVACQAAKSGVEWFAVAYLHEALALRAALPHAHILVLGVVDAADVPDLLAQRILPVVVSAEHGEALADAARAAGQTLPVHLKIDTGMSRLGVPWQDGASVLNQLCGLPGLDVQGLCSHFATVEPDQPAAAEAQYERFALVAEASPRPLFKHLSSSRAFLCQGAWDLDAVRPGIAAYGYGADDEGLRAHCRPVLQWKTTVVQVKAVGGGVPVGYYGTYVTPAPTRLAVVAAGYADGYLRTLSNRGHVLIRGRRHRVVGRVTMNWLTVDLGLDSEVCPGDEVVLIGEQGDEAVWASELARQCRTIAYEILTMINPAIERVYSGMEPS
jgi:alanine racemase